MLAIVNAKGKVFSEGVRNHDFERISALYTESAKYAKDDEDFLAGERPFVRTGGSSWPARSSPT